MKSMFLSILRGLIFLHLTKRIMVVEIIISVVLLFVGISVLVIIHICIVGRAFRRGFGTDGVLQRGSIPIIRSSGMTTHDLKKLPCFEYKESEEKGTSPADCAVCLETYKVGDKCRILPNCQHRFHAQCVDIWLIKTPLCPLCRTSAKPSSKVHDSVTGEQREISSNVPDDLL